MALTNNKVSFIKCTYSQYSAQGYTPDNNTLYFCTDTQEFYLGNKRFGFGLVSISGTGNAIESISFDNGTLEIVLGDAGLSDASEAAVYAILKAAESNTIAVTETKDGNNVVTGSVLSVKKDNTNSNVTLGETANGLTVTAAVGSLDTSNNKIIKLTGDVLGEYTLAMDLYTEPAGSADAGKKFLRLLGGANSSTEIARLDAADFIKDGMLDSATYDNSTHILTLTFNTDSGKSAVTVDLTGLVDVYSGDTTTIVENSGVFSMATLGQGGSTSSTAQTPTFGGDFTIPTVTYDAYGRVTSVGTATVTLPSLPAAVTGDVGAEIVSGNAPTKLVAYAALTGSTFSGDEVDVATSLSSASTDQQIPTAKAVYDALCWQTLS